MVSDNAVPLSLKASQDARKAALKAYRAAIGRQDGTAQSARKKLAIAVVHEIHAELELSGNMEGKS